MNREEVLEIVKREEQKRDAAKAKLDEIINYLYTSDVLTEDWKKELKKDYKKALQRNFDFESEYSLSLHLEFISFKDSFYGDALGDTDKEIELDKKYEEELKKKFGESPESLLSEFNFFNQRTYDGRITEEEYFMKKYLDSDWKKYKGDIIITDPCYLLTEDDERDFNYTNIFSSIIYRDTIYGDWSCHVFKDGIKDEEHVLGQFCADGGEVCVVLAEEVEKHNPKFFETHKDWTYTRIKNFDGEVRFEVEHTKGIYEDTTKYHNAGDTWEDFLVYVVGRGNINFISSQTGL